MNKTLFLAAALATVTLSASAFAYSPKDAVQPATPAIAKLTPSKVVNPTNLPQTFTQRVINIEFSLDASGQPHDIKLLGNTERAAVEQVVKAFKQWKFESRAADLTQRYVLPLEIVPGV